MLFYGVLAVSAAMRDFGLSTLASHHWFPSLSVRHRLLSVSKRVRYLMQRDGAVLGMMLRIFCRVIEQTLQASRPGDSTTSTPWWTSPWPQ
jgi:hypothetical protein